MKSKGMGVFAIHVKYFYSFFAPIAPQVSTVNRFVKGNEERGKWIMAKTNIVDWTTITNFVVDAFKGYGIPEEDAKICADVLLESDKRGIESHGCNRFKPIYLDRIKAGIQNPVTNYAVSYTHLDVYKRQGDYVRNLEERGLHDGVDAATHAHLAGDLDRVDGVELQVLFGDGILHGSGQLLVHLLRRPGAVEQELSLIHI